MRHLSGCLPVEPEGAGDFRGGVRGAGRPGQSGGWLAEMQPEEFREVFRGSPVRRAKLSGLRRNAVIAMGNSGDKKFVPTLKKLCENSDPVVAQHARWALARLERASPSTQA